jgi:hypothetical protein
MRKPQAMGIVRANALPAATNRTRKMAGEQHASLRWDERTERGTQFKNPASAALVCVHLILGKVVEVPVNDSCHLLIEQVE